MPSQMQSRFIIMESAHASAALIPKEGWPDLCKPHAGTASSDFVAYVTMMKNRYNMDVWVTEVASTATTLASVNAFLVSGCLAELYCAAAALLQSLCTTACASRPIALCR